MPKERDGTVQQGNNNGVLKSSNPAAIPLVPLLARVIDEATAPTDEHVEVRTHPTVDHLSYYETDACKMQDVAPHIQKRSTKSDLEHLEDTHATHSIDTTDSAIHYTPLAIIPDCFMQNEESCTNGSVNFVSNTPAPTGKAKSPTITFDKSILDHISSPPCSSQDACNSRAALPFAYPKSVTEPAAMETCDLLHEMPYHLGSPTDSPYAADETEDWIIGTISDLPHRLFSEQSHKRFFSGQTLFDSNSQQTYSPWGEVSYSSNSIQIKGSALGDNGNSFCVATEGKSLQVTGAEQRLENTGDPEKAFNAAWETVLESTETSYRNEIADLKDEHKDQVKNLKGEHAAALEQLNVKINSEESKKVVLQKRVKKLVEQLAQSKDEAKLLAEDLKEKTMAGQEARNFSLRRNVPLQEENSQSIVVVEGKDSGLISVRERFQASTQQQTDLRECYEKQKIIIHELKTEHRRLSGVISSLQHDLKQYSDGGIYEKVQQTVVGLEVQNLQQQLSVTSENLRAVLRTCAVYKDQARDWENRARQRTQEAERNGEIIDHEQTIASQRKALDDLTKDHNVKAKALIETKRQLETIQSLLDVNATQQDQFIQRQRDARTDLESRFRSLQVSNKTLIEILKASITKDTFTTGLSVEFDRMRDDNDFLIDHVLKQEIMIEEAAKECASLRIEHVTLEKTLEDERYKCRKSEESERMLKVQLDSAELKYEMLEGIHEGAIVEHNETAKNMTEQLQQRCEELDKVFTANASDQFRWQINQKDALISHLKCEVTNAVQIARDYQQELAKRQWSDDGDACISGLMERTLEDLRRDVQDAQKERDQANEELVACEHNLRQKLSDLDFSNDQSERRRQLGVVLRDWAIHLENMLGTNGLLDNAEHYMARRNQVFATANDLLLEPDGKMKNFIKAEVKSITNTPDSAEENTTVEGEPGPSNGRVANRSQEAGATSYSFNDSDIF